MCLLKYTITAGCSCKHTYTNETFSGTSTRFNPYFGIMMYCYACKLFAKVWIKPCRGGRECISSVHVCM